jgi:hypothetical protein
VSGAVQRDHFTGLARDRYHVIGGRMVNEQGVAAIANRQMHGLVGPPRELLHILLGDSDQHGAPIVTVGEPPQSRTKRDEVLTVVGQAQKPRRFNVKARRKTLLRSIPARSVSSFKEIGSLELATASSMTSLRSRL